MRAQEFQPQPIYYFAYGMLTNPRHMPGARPVGAAVLPNHSFEFQQFADVVPEPGSRVHGVLWEIPRELLAQLDRVEGVPYLYNRKTVPVRVNGERYEAYIYTMTPSARDEVKSAAPSQSYVKTLGQGYARFDLPADQINQALVRAREVTEVAMNPAAYADSMTAAAERGVLVGFEFEVCVPDETMKSARKEQPAKAGIDYLWTVVGSGNAEDIDLDLAGFNQLFRQTAPFRVDRKSFDSMQQYVEYEKNRLTNDVKETFRELSEPRRQKLIKKWKEFLAGREGTESEFIEWLEVAAYQAAGKVNWNDPDWDRLIRIRNRVHDMSEQETIYDFLDVIPENQFSRSFEWDDAALVARYRERAEEFDNEYDDGGDSDDANYDRAARVLEPAVADTMGARVKVFQSYHERRKNTTDWYIEPDGSLRPNEPDDGTAEIVSPPLPVQQAMSDLKKFYGMARQMNLYTNETTGLHINVSIPGDLDILKLAVFLGDDYVLRAFDREDSDYAVGVLQNLQRGADPETMLRKRRGRTELDFRALKKLAQDSTESHFASISDNGKYISFRHSGGDYLRDSEAITNVVGRFVRAMVIAADPAAYRSEYLKKLAALVARPAQQEIKASPKDILALRRQGVPVWDIYAWRFYYSPEDQLIRDRILHATKSFGLTWQDVQVNQFRATSSAVAPKFAGLPQDRDRKFGRYLMKPLTVRAAIVMQQPAFLQAAAQSAEINDMLGLVIEPALVPITDPEVSNVAREIGDPMAAMASAGRS